MIGFDTALLGKAIISESSDAQEACLQQVAQNSSYFLFVLHHGYFRTGRSPTGPFGVTVPGTTWTVTEVPERAAAAAP